MGDKPEPILNSHQCSDLFWKNGLQPDCVRLTLTGWDKGPDWWRSEPPLPNGVHYLDWHSCGLWWIEPPGQCFEVRIGHAGLIVFVKDFLGLGLYMSEKPISDLHYPEFGIIGPYHTWSIGDSVLELFSSGSMPPKSWDAGRLLGVPIHQDYFAEDQNPSATPRFSRFSSHKTKSVLHVKGAF